MKTFIKTKHAIALLLIVTAGIPAVLLADSFTPAEKREINVDTPGLFEKSKSIFLKNLKIRRIFDEKHQTLMYVSYSTKETSGSFKHSLSTIPLWGTRAYMRPTASSAEGSGI